MSENKKGLLDEDTSLFDKDATGNEFALRAVLHRWHAPVPSASLDERVLSTFRCQTDAAVAATVNLQAAQSPNNQSEVAKMKECPTCHENFADRFVFCPTDGTPLMNGFHAANASDTDATVEAANLAAASEAANDGDVHEVYHLTMLQDAGLLNRLTTQIQTETREFKRDPKGYTDSLFVDVLAALKRPMTAAATLASILLVLGAIGVFIMLDGIRVTQASNREQVQWIGPNDFLTEIPKEEPTPEPEDKGVGVDGKGRVGLNKGRGEGSNPQPKRAQGGGGGGYEEPEPARQGRILPPSEIPIALPKTPNPPKLPPVFRGGSQIDPALYRNLPFPNTGNPLSNARTDSMGPGTNGGAGTGTGTGAGSGEGGGLGPGRGGNVGGGDRAEGGGGSGGGRGGNPNPAPDPNRIFKTSELTRRIQIVSKPEPGYTEDARKNNIQGTVSLRVLFASNGTVSSVSPLKRLPDGLTEKAIAAAKQIKFVPAEKDGRKVSTWAQVNYAFNIY